MPKNQNRRAINPVRLLQKFAVSTFVVCSFGAYAVHEYLANPNAATSAASTTPSAVTQASPDSPTAAPTSPQLSLGAPQNAPIPSITPPRAAARPAPSATLASAGAFKNGTYTGPSVDAFYGTVRVKAVIQNGKMTDVQFLEYPSDRRTSVRINQQAMPWLQSEAIQAQSANVDVISGATLTSEAFALSLRTALSSAKN